MEKISPSLKWVGGLALVRNLDGIIMNEMNHRREASHFKRERLGSDKGMHPDYMNFMIVEFDDDADLKRDGIVGKSQTLDYFPYDSDDELEAIIEHYDGDEGAFALMPGSRKVAHVEHYNPQPESRLADDKNLYNFLESLTGMGIFRYDETDDYSLISKKIGTKFKVGMNLVESPEKYGIQRMTQLKGNIHSPLGMSTVVSYDRDGRLEVLQFLREEDIQGNPGTITDYIDAENGIVCLYSAHQLGGDFRFREVDRKYLSRSDFSDVDYLPSEVYKAPESANQGLLLLH